MSLRSPRTDMHPATISRTFVPAAAQIVLADQLEASGATSPAGAPGPGIDHLPTSLFIVASAGKVFAWTDIFGTVNSLTFAAGYTGPLPWSARTIESTTNVEFVTVLWHPES